MGDGDDFIHPLVPITTADSFPVAGLEWWEIENPDSNTTSIFLNEAAAATTTATQSTEVAPGRTKHFFFNARKTPVVSMIAATSATRVNLRKRAFRHRASL